MTLQNSDAFVLRYMQRQSKAGIVTETKRPYILTNEVGLSKCDFRRETAQLINECVYVCILLLLLSRSVVSDSLRLQGLRYARPPCPSPAPGACSNSSIESVMPSDHLILCHPLLLPPSVFPSIIYVCVCVCVCVHVVQESIMYHSKTSCLVGL